MRAQVLVDMDGVLADVYAQYIKLEREKTGLTLHVEDMYGKKEEDISPSISGFVRSKGFFRTAPLIADSFEGLKYLNDKYKVLIVSSATEFPQSLIEKHEWLNRHFPFIGWQQMIFCGSKDSIKGDVMIDDHLKNLCSFEGERILFTQPHNVYVNDETLKRVSSWKEIMSMI